MQVLLAVLVPVLVALAWVGHACLWTAVLNYVYGRDLPKVLLKPWRYVTGALILAFPVVLIYIPNPDHVSWEPHRPGEDPFNGTPGRVLLAYGCACAVLGAAFPALTVARHRRKPPACLAAESTRTADLWPVLGRALVGDGKNRLAVWAPGNCVFRYDVTDYTLAVPGLPPEWDGLTALVLSDLHFHGTPSRLYFERLLADLTAGPVPDLVLLPGDFVDSDAHRAWIVPLLGRLSATGAKLAVLGNHDEFHDPGAVRAELAAAGYVVLGNGWREITVRGVRCVAVGHEGPWFRPPPDLTDAPPGLFRLCVSHTPDNFYWAQANGVGLMVCGHVHGGAIRIPVVGSIFVPSVYGRRFDTGVFEGGGTVMVVSRGVSGKEPLRIRCNPQAVRITLKVANRVPGAA
jgi:predicted MPP superfamily phosphohydrolase